jgi:hypothetical protein
VRSFTAESEILARTFSAAVEVGEGVWPEKALHLTKIVGLAARADEELRYDSVAIDTPSTLPCGIASGAGGLYEKVSGPPPGALQPRTRSARARLRKHKFDVDRTSGTSAIHTATVVPEGRALQSLEVRELAAIDVFGLRREAASYVICDSES